MSCVPTILPVLLFPLTTVAAPVPKEVILFDFEDAADVKAWSNLESSDAKLKEPS